MHTHTRLKNMGEGRCQGWKWQSRPRERGLKKKMENSHGSDILQGLLPISEWQLEKRQRGDEEASLIRRSCLDGLVRTHHLLARARERENEPPWSGVTAMLNRRLLWQYGRRVGRRVGVTDKHTPK